MKTTKIILAFLLFLSVQLISFGQTKTSLYYEGFSSAKNWSTGNNDIRVLEIKNGKYYFEHKRDSKNWNITTREIDIDTSKDFEIETSLQRLSGEKGYAYGLIYGTKNADNTLHFIISDDQYRISEKKDGKFIPIKSWTAHASIKKEYYTTNILKIRKRGNTVYFYINNTLVTSLSHKPFYGKRLGVLVYNKQKISIDYIKASKLESSTTTSASKKTILFEGFNNNNNSWLTKDDATAKLEVTNGNYDFEHKRTTGGWTSTLLKKFDTSRDFRISAQIKK